MRRTVLGIVPILWAALAAAAGQARPEPPYTGQVTGERVYIRGGDGITYSVLSIADRGDRVRVKERRFDWLGMDVPQSGTVWVSRKLLKLNEKGDEATVAGDKVNIRARPKTSADVLGQLPEGAQLKVVDQDGDWVGVAPPPQATAWIHGRYVEKAAEEQPAPVAPPTEAKEGMDAAAGAALLRKAAEVYRAELAKPAGERDFGAVLKSYQEVASKCQDQGLARQAEQTRQRLLKLVDLLDTLKAARQPIEEFEKKYDALEKEYKRRAGQSGDK